MPNTREDCGKEVKCVASQVNEEGELIFGEQLEISKKVIFAKSSYLQDYFLVDSLFEQLNIFEQQIGVILSLES